MKTVEEFKAVYAQARTGDLINALVDRSHFLSPQKLTLITAELNNRFAGFDALYFESLRLRAIDESKARES